MSEGQVNEAKLDDLKRHYDDVVTVVLLDAASKGLSIEDTQKLLAGNADIQLIGDAVDRELQPFYDERIREMEAHYKPEPEEGE